MYINEAKYDAFAKGKSVKHFGNPYYKEVDGEVVHIIPKNEEVVVRVLDEDEKNWYCNVTTDDDVVEMEMTIDGWFPTELVCGVVLKTQDGRPCMEHFSMRTKLAKDTGWLLSTGSLGSRSDIFLASKADVAIRKLKKSGYKIKDLRK